MTRRCLLPALATLSLLVAAPPALADTTTGGVAPGAAPALPPSPASVPDRPTVSGTRATIVNGVAFAPAAAPAPVKRLIWMVNGIVQKPYVYGGGHASFRPDRGYDCSGLVSYAMHAAGLLSTPVSAPGFLRFGTAGPGEWITVWARSGHVFAQVAGLRLDTSAADDRSGARGPRWRPLRRSNRGYRLRHPVGL